MGIECDFSFIDLYQAAHHKKPEREEMSSFGKISQAERNELVKQWAKRAGWHTKDKMGNDGQVYTAFAPMPF